MEILNKIVYVIMLLSALGVIVLVLLQHGKGADMGTGFGAGASGSLFGATGSANFLSRTTKYCAGVFFVATLPVDLHILTIEISRVLRRNLHLFGDTAIVHGGSERPNAH